MRRFVIMTAGLLAGTVVGAVLVMAAQGVSTTPPSTVEVAALFPTSHETGVTGGGAHSDESTPTSSSEPVPISDQVLLVWTPGGLPPGLTEQIGSYPGVDAVTVVHSDLVHMSMTEDATGATIDQPPDGFVVPIEVIGFDPVTYSAFLPKGESVTFTSLAAGEVILGSTSAHIRGLGEGAVVVLDDGTQLTVVAVVDDVLIGSAEAAVTVATAESLGVVIERYLLVRYSGERKGLESSIRAGLPEGLAVRIRAPGETPVLRHGDAVLPQVLIKDQFGEFWFRPTPGDVAFDIGAAWMDDNIVAADVPLLGAVTCHRNLVPALAGAMEELIQRNLSFLIRPEEFRGCFNPRYIANGKGISRHAWGAAVDINLTSNPEGLESAQDPRLIEVMERWGFTSGHDWLVPDPGHFEYIQPARGR